MRERTLLLKTIAAGFAGEKAIGQPNPECWFPSLSFSELIVVHKLTLAYIKSRVENVFDNKLKELD
jgi:hypothetical protein